MDFQGVSDMRKSAAAVLLFTVPALMLRCAGRGGKQRGLGGAAGNMSR